MCWYRSLQCWSESVFSRNWWSPIALGSATLEDPPVEEVSKEDEQADEKRSEVPKESWVVKTYSIVLFRMINWFHVLSIIIWYFPSIDIFWYFFCHWYFLYVRTPAAHQSHNADMKISCTFPKMFWAPWTTQRTFSDPPSASDRANTSTLTNFQGSSQ